MVKLPRRTRLAVLVRSLAVQGSWNYRTLLGTGFAFALLPALRRIHAADDAGALEAATRRHSVVFNSHPYLSPVALGAVARLEAEGADPAVIERFKSAVRGALGSLGDRLVWAGWRPVCVLLGLAVWLAGAPAWAAAAIFLAVYNLGHVALRAWAFHVGLRDGLRVAERFRGSRIGRVERALAPAGAFLLGVSIPLAATGGGPLETGMSPGPVGLALVAAAVGVAVGGRVRSIAVAVVLLAAVGGVVGGWFA